MKLKIYNTQRITDEDAISNFVARQKEFKVLMNILQNFLKGRSPQHQLIIGQRGMGKTTLLKRIEVELRQDPFNTRFLPLLFPEEQYNLDNLATFWLNCLDAIADIRDIQGDKEGVQELDDEIERLSKIQDITARADKAYRFFCHITFNLGRVPVLLIDNIDFVFKRLSIDELHILRACLTESGAPIIIGASSQPVEEADNYNSPFYDAFQVHFLKKLNNKELVDMMNMLSTIAGAENVKKDIIRHRSRLKAINQLTGGNPRTAVILFNQIIKGFSETIVEDLDLILDELTPLYKARYEELSEKQQIIVNAIAMNWDPLSLEKLKPVTGLDSGQLSPQLKRLAETGWIDKPANEKYKGGAYELCERMFNIWYLMRRSSRRQKKGVFCLSKYLEAFYANEEELQKWISAYISWNYTKHQHVLTALALARLSTDKELRWRLHAKSREYITTNPDFIQQVETSDLFDSVEESLQALEDAIREKDAQQIVLTSDAFIDLPKTPKRASILRNRAIAMLELGRLNDCHALLESEGMDIPEIESLWVGLAVAKHNSGDDADKVEYCLRQAIQVNPSYTESHFFLAKLYMEQGKLKEAEGSLKIAKKVYPAKAIQPILLQGLLCAIVGEDEKSIRILRKVVEKQPDNPDALFTLGRTLCKAKREDYGLQYFLNLQAIDPDNTRLDAWLVVCYEKRGETEKAQAALSRIESIPVRMHEVLVRIASIYEDDKDLESAVRYWKKAVLLDDSDKDSIISIVASSVEMNDYEQAEHYMESLVTLSPGDPNILFFASLIHVLRDNLDKALEFVSKAIEIEPSGERYHLLASVQEQKMLYEDARRSFNQALQFEFLEKEEVLQSLGRLELLVFNNPSAAEDCFSKIQESNPYPLISLYRDYMDRKEEARTLFASIPDSEKSTDNYVLEQILFLLDGGQVDDAEKMLEKWFMHQMEKGTIPDRPDCFIRFSTICLKHSFGKWLLQELDRLDLREDLSPDYHAIAAVLSGNPDGYLDTVAQEIREVSKEIIKEMRMSI